MSGLKRILAGELSQSKSKGKKFLAEQLSKLSPSSIAALNKKGVCGDKGYGKK